MSRRMRITVVLACLSIIVMGAGYLALHNTSTPVPVDKAVDQFRKQIELAPQAGATSAPKTSATKQSVGHAAPAQATAGKNARASLEGIRPVPPAGVYVYATTGHDHIDVLGGSTHTYPKQTTITIRHTACGISERWDALAERWDDTESCHLPDGDHLKSFSAHHEFFKHSDDRTYQCSGFTYPKGAKPGDRWVDHCIAGQSDTATTITAIAFETLTVGGKPVRTLHVHGVTNLTGEQQGSSERDVWGSTDDGIMVRERSHTQSTSNQPVFGKATYTEQYEIDLTSLTPRT